MLNSQWSSSTTSLNPPEPLPMGGKALRDVGYVGGGGGMSAAASAAGRQITKRDPMNILGGMGGSVNGNYTNGSSGGGGFGVYGESRSGGGSFGDSFGRSALGGGGGGMVRDATGLQRGGVGYSAGLGGGGGGGGGGSSGMLGKMPPNTSGGGGSGYTTDGYGMGAMGPGGGRGGNQGRGSPPGSGTYGNGYVNGNGGMFGSGGGLRDLEGRGRDLLRTSSAELGGLVEQRSMLGGMMGGRDLRGDLMGGGGGRDFMGGGRDIIGGGRDLMGGRDMLSNRDMMTGGRDIMGDRRDMLAGGGRERDILDARDMLSSRERELLLASRDMMGSGRDYLRSTSEIVGLRDPLTALERLERLERLEKLERSLLLEQQVRERESAFAAVASSHRSMSMSNGGGRGGGGGGFGSMSHGLGRDEIGGGGGGSFGRSMSYHGGPPSPPGGGSSDLKIGTWNDSIGSSSQQMGNSSGGGFPPVSNFEIGTFNINDPGSRSFGSGGGVPSGFGQMGHGNHHNGATQSNNGPIQPGMGIRETGIIEKLLHSYGFIQCCDRQARLFFHFSQFDGNIEHLKIGDPVEFEMTYDRRTGKPIASAVSKIAPEVVMSEERVMGTVTTEVKVSPEGVETQGRISYENRGECFFLPFNNSDVEGNVTLASGDKVSFQMATVQRSGNLAAKTIRLENPASPVKYQGVVNSLKDTFGFIERADVVKEIFFHLSETGEGGEEDNSHIQLGDDVEFIIQTRNGKEVACQLTKLPPGTVVFEDVGLEYFTGQVLKPLDRTGRYQQTDALPGRVKYRAADRSEVEVPFGEKDQVGDFTLRHGDWIKFIIATDRRDKLKRATKIELLDESFKVSDERREQGVVQAMKEGFGFLSCVDRSEKMFFHFSECLDVTRKLALGDEVEFTVTSDPAQLGRQLATRIKHLPPGTVKFDIVIAQNIVGLVAEEPTAFNWGQRSPNRLDSPGSKEGAGRIVYELNGLQLSIPLFAADCDLRTAPKVGDQVQFNINQLKATKETNAINVRILESANPEPPTPQQPAAAVMPASQTSPQRPPTAAAAAVAAGPTTPTGSLTDIAAAVNAATPPREKKDSTRLGSPQKGYVAALKDGFGFIETLQHDKEIFFHFSNIEGKGDKLEVGQEVEYSVYSREKGGKVSAEGVKLLAKGSIPPPACKEELLYGKVARPLRSVNPDQADYCGLIVCKNEEGRQVGEYLFGIASLLNKKELLQEGDPVNFQVSVSEPFALNVKSNKQKLRSHVEAVKGQFGFLSYEQEEGKKLFFHMSEVEGGEILQVGDEVEFVVVTNQRTRKHSACCVRKLCVSQRPERLISKLKTMNIEEVARGGPRIIVVRQPRGPDGTKGFKPRCRQEPEKETVLDLMDQLTAQ